MRLSNMRDFNGNHLSDVFTPRFADKLNNLRKIDNEIANMLYDFVQHVIKDARALTLRGVCEGGLACGELYTFIKYFTPFSPVAIYIDIEVTETSIVYSNFFVDGDQPIDPTGRYFSRFIPFIKLEMKGIKDMDTFNNRLQH